MQTELHNTQFSQAWHVHAGHILDIVNGLCSSYGTSKVLTKFMLYFQSRKQRTSLPQYKFLVDRCISNIIIVSLLESGKILP